MDVHLSPAVANIAIIAMFCSIPIFAYLALWSERKAGNALWSTQKFGNAWMTSMGALTVLCLVLLVPRLY